jgi:hypothetical protein
VQAHVRLDWQAIGCQAKRSRNRYIPRSFSNALDVWKGSKVIAELKLSDVQRAEVCEELDRILADPKFNGSGRCVTLLQHLVDVTLKGDQDRIKERTLGVEVFGRHPNYDTNADTIVRRTAVEMRKRLAQYYQDPNSQHTVRIGLLAGSYVPQFDFDHHPLPPRHVGGKEISEPVPAPESRIARPDPPIRPGRRGGWMGWTAAAVLTLGAMLAVTRVASTRLGFLLTSSGFSRPTSYFVWRPLLNSSGDMIVCVSDQPPPVAPNVPASAESQTVAGLVVVHRPSMLSSDVNVAFRIDKQLSAYGRSVTLASASSLKMREFAGRPVILIGGINYPLAMMIESKLRYSLGVDRAIDERWIQDAQAPSHREWNIQGTPEQSKAHRAMLSADSELHAATDGVEHRPAQSIQSRTRR